MPMHLRRDALPRFFHIGHAPALLDAPTRYRVERWGADNLSGGDAEARMMPGTADSVLDEETINKWSAVMSARRAESENLMAASDKQHRFTSGVTEKHGPIRNTRNLDPLSEIRPAGFCIVLVHLTSLVISGRSAASAGQLCRAWSRL